jgi:hypothetical protein
MSELLASSDPGVLAWQQVATWPSLGFFGIEPLGDKESLLHLAARVESDGQLEPHERHLVAQYLRMLAASPALDALRTRKRGAPAGRGWNIALHYAVQYKLTGNSTAAAQCVGNRWGVSPKSVQDNKAIEKARAEVESVIKLRLAGPSYHLQPNGALLGPKEWTETSILEAMDADLRSRRRS